MIKKEEKIQNNNNVQFEALKQLNNIISNSEMQSFVSSISKAKKAIETFCKNLKDREVVIQNNIKKQDEIISAKKVETEQVQEKVANESTTNSVEVKQTIEPNTSNNDFASTSIVSNPKQQSFNQQNNFKNNKQADFRQGNGFNRNNGYQNNGGNNQNNQRFNNQNRNNYNQNGYKNGASEKMQSKPFDRKPFDKSGKPNQTGGFNKTQNGNKPFNKDGNKGGFRSTGLLPKADVSETLVVKNDRNFGANKSKAKSNNSEKKELSLKSKIKMGYIDIEDYSNGDEDRIGRVRVKPKKQKEYVAPEKVNIDHAVITTDNLTVKLLSEKIGKPSVDIIKKFMMLGMMPNINSVIDFQTAELVAAEFGVTLEQKIEKNYEEKLQEMISNQSNNISNRPPIVTVMGHVDHGKTSLLDAIRKTNVVAGEAGAITQHIGAYSVEINGQKITFIDTPGHEAFTAMRARGAKITDVAILVVAADDGIMPQTVEAINHIKAAGVPMVVAINKMDKPEANPDRIKQQLTEYGIVPEEWGGDTICVPISAKFNKNIDKLLEMVLLVSEVADLRADSSVPASGNIIESKIDKGRGIVATIIVKNGTLKIGNFVVSGVCSGKIRAMVDSNGNAVVEAGPSMAVSVLGFNNVPNAGDSVYVVDEKMAKNIIEERTAKLQLEKSNQTSNITLEDFLQQSADSEHKVLNIIIKADVKGSAEALKQTLESIKNEEVVVKCIHDSVGSINESDVLLAQASNAIIVAFNTKPEAKAKTLADKNKVSIKFYRVIYDAVDEITNIINGMITPKYEEQVTGHAEIRHIFKISSIGNIAGSYVLDGVIMNKGKVRLIRNGEVIVQTEIATLQQQKDEVKSMKAGYECGIRLKNFNDIKLNDIIECYELKQI